MLFLADMIRKKSTLIHVKLFTPLALLVLNLLIQTFKGVLQCFSNALP